MFALLAWDAGNTAGGSQRWSSGLPAGADGSALSTPGMPDVPSAPAPPPATCTVSDAAAFRLWLGGQSSADCPGGQQQDSEPPPAAGSVATGGAEEPAAASCCGGRSLPLVALVAEVGQVCYAAACDHASALWMGSMLRSALKRRWCLLNVGWLRCTRRCTSCPRCSLQQTWHQHLGTRCLPSNASPAVQALRPAARWPGLPLPSLAADGCAPKRPHSGGSGSDPHSRHLHPLRACLPDRPLGGRQAGLPAHQLQLAAAGAHGRRPGRPPRPAGRGSTAAGAARRGPLPPGAVLDAGGCSGVCVAAVLAHCWLAQGGGK